MIPQWWWYFYLAVVVFCVGFGFAWLLVSDAKGTEYVEHAMYYANISDEECPAYSPFMAIEFCILYDRMKLDVLPDKREGLDEICEEILNRSFRRIFVCEYD